jgi:hypothetical protein
MEEHEPFPLIEVSVPAGRLSALAVALEKAEAQPDR